MGMVFGSIVVDIQTMGLLSKSSHFLSSPQEKILKLSQIPMNHKHMGFSLSLWA